MKGDNHNPLYPQVEEFSKEMAPQDRVVFDCKIDLAGLPDETYGLTVLDTNKELMQEAIGDEPLEEHQYRVDYTHGYVYFHPVHNKKTVTIEKYYSRGMLYFPASRVYSIDEHGRIDIQNTLQEYIDSVKSWIFQGDYQSARTYTANNSVYFEGSVYIAKQDVPSNKPPKSNPKYWQLMAGGFSYCGEYEETKTYYPREIVSYQQGYYGCIHESVQAAPSNAENWVKIVSVDSIYEAWHGEDGNGGLKRSIETTLQNAEAARDEIAGTWLGADGQEGLKDQMLSAVQDCEATTGFVTTLGNELKEWKFAGEYAADATYKKNNIVHARGGIYIALADGNSGAPGETPEQWQELASGFVFCGEADAGAQYQPRDVVVSADKHTLYLCKQPCSGDQVGNLDYFEVLLDVSGIVEQLLQQMIPNDFISKGQLTAALRTEIDGKVQKRNGNAADIVFSDGQSAQKKLNDGLFGGKLTETNAGQGITITESGGNSVISATGGVNVDIMPSSIYTPRVYFGGNLTAVKSGGTVLVEGEANRNYFYSAQPCMQPGDTWYVVEGATLLPPLTELAYYDFRSGGARSGMTLVKGNVSGVSVTETAEGLRFAQTSTATVAGSNAAVVNLSSPTGVSDTYYYLEYQYQYRLRSGYTDIALFGANGTKGFTQARWNNNDAPLMFEVVSSTQSPESGKWCRSNLYTPQNTTERIGFLLNMQRATLEIYRNNHKITWGGNLSFAWSNSGLGQIAVRFATAGKNTENYLILKEMRLYQVNDRNAFTRFLPGRGAKEQ